MVNFGYPYNDIVICKDSTDYLSTDIYVSGRLQDTGQLPDDWKLANVVPVFKKGNTSLAANYRPISLTCVSCKIMEHIITSNVMRHASTHNILYHLQHGFRDKRSCETQLLEFQNDIVANMNNGKQTDVTGVALNFYFH